MRRRWAGVPFPFTHRHLRPAHHHHFPPHHQPLTTFTSDDERYDNVEGFPRLILHLGTHLTFGSDHSEWSEARAEGT